MDQLRGQLDSQKEDHQRQMETFQESIEKLNGTHQKEVAQLQNLLTDYYKPKCSDSPCPSEEVQPCLLDQIKTLVADMEAAHQSQEHFQKELALAHQDMENLREELTQQGARHQEEMKALEEDCEMERERLLLLHDELTEQLALKGKPTLHTHALSRTVNMQYHVDTASPFHLADKAVVIEGC